MNYYKPLRSHLDGVTYFVEAAPATAKAVSCVSSLWESAETSLELPVPIIQSVATASTSAAAGLCEAFTAQSGINL